MVFFRDLGITHHNFHKIYKVSQKKFFCLGANLFSNRLLSKIGDLQSGSLQIRCLKMTNDIIEILKLFITIC